MCRAGLRQTPRGRCWEGACTAPILLPCFRRVSGRHPAGLLLWLAPQPSPAPVLPRKWRDEHRAQCMSKRLPLKRRGRDCRAPGRKGGCYCQLPRTESGQGDPPSASMAAAALLRRSSPVSHSTVFQALTRERKQPRAFQRLERV